MPLSKIRNRDRMRVNRAANAKWWRERMERQWWWKKGSDEYRAESLRVYAKELSGRVSPLPESRRYRDTLERS